jgi:transposase InsO family protein
MTKEYITFGDNGKGRVLSVGTVKVSEFVTLGRVSLVKSLVTIFSLFPSFLMRVLKSVSKCVSHFSDSRGDLACTIAPKGHIFRAHFSQCVGSSRCLVAGVSAELWKWHRRLGHLTFDLLSHLSGLGLVRGLPKLKYQKGLVCAPCRHGMMVAASHPTLIYVMTERPCELFHMDLVGPARVCSTGGKWYVLVIVDDYSLYAWVFFLSDKWETFGFVRDLILRLKNERNGYSIRAIRSDNGTEFKNSHFEIFCHDLGLEHQFTSPYVACQNDVVERKNRSLCEMARTMLDEHRTQRIYWAEAVNNGCHVGNQIFLRAFLNKTCYELMHGRAPRVSHFRSFGCQWFILKKGMLDKFELRSSDGIFLGYASHSRAFRVLNLDTNLVMETWEVTFDETQPCKSSVFECACTLYYHSNNYSAGWYIPYTVYDPTRSSGSSC